MSRILVLSIVTLFFCACQEGKKKTLESVLHTALENKIDSINTSLNAIGDAQLVPKLKEHLATCRKQYKKIEPFVEYYFQGFSRRVNGPALPEIKTDDNVVNAATGFQVLEEIIYSDSIDVEQLKVQAKILTTDLRFIKQNFANLPVRDHHVYELIQHQIIRVATLGITGFDSPVALRSIEESRYSLEGIAEIYRQYCEIAEKEPNREVIRLVKKATDYVASNNEFSSFDRLNFIRSNLMPLSKALSEDFQVTIDATPNFKDGKVFFGNLADLMQGKSLNPDAFSAFADSKSSPEKVALGELLFNDNTLSRSGTMSCATCHQAEKAFTDGKKVSNANIHSTNVSRNSPTLLYSSFQKAFFYDLRAQDLENQIESVMRNPDEFDLSPQEIQQNIIKRDHLGELFAKAYPNKKDVTPYEVRNAIAAYVRSLMPFESKIDHYFKDKAALTESEVNGFNLFAGKAKCATCHFIPLYSGTIPPWYNNTESEVIGVPRKITWQNAEIDSDVGRYKLNEIDELKYSFKTPTVRNIDLTAPYMHNGVYNTLEDVVRFYDVGGGNGIGLDLKHQTLPFDKLDLSQKEKNDIVSFLKALTDVVEE
jgi:cytochrome c peroxidase